jgi:hypothetical protein
MEKKNTSKIRVCIDFRNLNKTTLKDEYPMPIADMLINNASGHQVISFLDGNASYNLNLYGPREHVQNGFSLSWFYQFI